MSPGVAGGIHRPIEIELQYVYRGDAQPVVPTRLAELPLARSDSFTLVDTYLDTEQLDLRRVGCSLRIRVSDGDARARLTWKGPSRRWRKRGKKRTEVEVPIDGVPDGGEAVATLLERHGIDRLARKACGLGDPRDLRAIGRLRNDRSRHTYVGGLHRLELTWDDVAFPVGPREVRIEVEVKSKLAHRRLAKADDELRALFGDDLRRPKRGKVRELCERLYPELIGES